MQCLLDYRHLFFGVTFWNRRMKFRAKRPKSQGITASYHPAAVPHIRPNDGSLGCSTKVFLFTTKRPARQSRNQNSEYLAQRRKGRKEI